MNYYNHQCHVYNDYCKSSTLFAVNYQPLRIIINKSTTFIELKKVIKVAWRINPTNLRLFLSDGSEIYESDLQCIRQGTKLYASINGQDLDLNILFLNYTIKGKISQQINTLTMLGMVNKTKKQVVIKQFKVHNYTQDEFTDIIRVVQLEKEQHSNFVVQINQMITFIKLKQIVLVTDYCEGGTLKTYTTVTDLRILVKQICESVAFYHLNNIVIKNLKLENFLFYEKDNIKSLKITDVGLNNIHDVFHMTSIENFNYYSPELLKQKQFSYSSDIWALGVIIYYLIFNKFPFDGRRKQNIQQNIFSFKYDFDEDCPLILRDLIQAIFTIEEKRLNIQEILQHPWLNQQTKQVSFKKDFRGRTHSLRINSEDNNLSLKKTTKLVQREPRKRCFSHILMKRQNFCTQT